MSSSILTNASALTALQALSATQRNIQKTEDQISTGLKIATASDNAAYWSIGTKMSSQTSALGAVSDALSSSGALLSTMTTALNSTLTIMTAIKNDLISASQPGADASSIQTAINAQIQALLAIGSAANFNGQNFLQGTGATVSLVASYDAGNTSAQTPVMPTIGTIDIDTTSTVLFETNATTASTGILGTNGVLAINIIDAGTGNVDLTAVNTALQGVQTAFDSITTASAQLGATSTNIANQRIFISSLSDSLKNGVSALVDADMNEASTRLSALQVQQQLGIQALSIANSNTQLILRLFQG